MQTAISLFNSLITGTVNITTTGDFVTNGNRTITGTLNVTGISTLSGAVTASFLNATGGSILVGGNLTVSGTSTFDFLTVSNLNVSGDLNITGNLDVNGTPTIGSIAQTNLNVSGTATFQSGCTVSGTLSAVAFTNSNNSATTFSYTGTSGSLLISTPVNTSSDMISFRGPSSTGFAMKFGPSGITDIATLYQAAAADQFVPASVSGDIGFQTNTIAQNFFIGTQLTRLFSLASSGITFPTGSGPLTNVYPDVSAQTANNFTFVNTGVTLVINMRMFRLGSICVIYLGNATTTTAGASTATFTFPNAPSTFPNYMKPLANSTGLILVSIASSICFGQITVFTSGVVRFQPLTNQTVAGFNSYFIDNFPNSTVCGLGAPQFFVYSAQ
jgi:hypothetical protein